MRKKLSSENTNSIYSKAKEKKLFNKKCYVLNEWTANNNLGVIIYIKECFLFLVYKTCYLIQILGHDCKNGPAGKLADTRFSNKHT